MSKEILFLMSETEEYKRGDAHLIAITFCGWVTIEIDDSIIDQLTRLKYISEFSKESDKQPGVAIWYVPKPVSFKYGIDNYVPDVEGVQLILECAL